MAIEHQFALVVGLVLYLSEKLSVSTLRNDKDGDRNKVLDKLKQ